MQARRICAATRCCPHRLRKPPALCPMANMLSAHRWARCYLWPLQSCAAENLCPAFALKPLLHSRSTPTLFDPGTMPCPSHWSQCLCAPCSLALLLHAVKAVPTGGLRFRSSVFLAQPCSVFPLRRSQCRTLQNYKLPMPTTYRVYLHRPACFVKALVNLYSCSQLPYGPAP